MNTLEAKTLEYWILNQCWVGRASAGVDVTTQGALSVLTEICDNLNPARPLALKVFKLRNEIIEGGKRTYG